MINQQPRISVGIPAFNEEANIGYLLQDLLQQKEDGFVLEKILIVSDGSSDRTVEFAREISDSRIEVIEHRDRRGKAARENEILEMMSSDILVLLDADVVLSGQHFLSCIIRPIIHDGADLVGAKIISVPAETFVEKILEVGMQLKTKLFEEYLGGKNVYTCGGAARALSRRFYRRLRFLDKVGEDAYSYFFCITNRFSYAYAKDAVVAIKLPDILSDHISQSERFVHSREKFYENFDVDMIKREYALSLSPITKILFSSGVKFALYVFLYAGIVMLVRVKSLFGTSSSHVWTISKSSKDLRRDKGICLG